MKLLVCLAVVIVSASATVAPFLTPCKWDDKACLISTSQKMVPILSAGIPELGLGPAEPLHLKDVKGDQGDLKLTFHELEVYGFSKCQFLKLERDIEKSTILLELTCPITTKGNYEVGGKLFHVPIEGKGPCEIKTDKIKIDVVATIEKVEQGGKKYWNIQKYEPSFDLIDQVHFKLDNLFNGDQEKAKPVVDLLNLSWKDITLTIGKPIIKELINKAVEHIQDFIKLIPENEIEVL